MFERHKIQTSHQQEFDRLLDDVPRELAEAIGACGMSGFELFRQYIDDKNWTHDEQGFTSWLNTEFCLTSVNNDSSLFELPEVLTVAYIKESYGEAQPSEGSVTEGQLQAMGKNEIGCIATQIVRSYTSR